MASSPPNLDGFVTLVNGQDELIGRAPFEPPTKQTPQSEQVIRDQVPHLSGLLEPFEFLTDNDPTLRMYVTDRISMEWGDDCNPKITPPVLGCIPWDSEGAVRLGMPASLDLGRFVQMCQIRLQKQARAVAERHGERAIHEHIVFLIAYREAFEVLTDNDPDLRAYVTARIPMDWDTDR